MPTINAARLLADLHRVADFGRYKTGVHRPTFSPQDMEARRWLVEKLEEAGLAATIDGVGNVIGRSRAVGPRLLVGSHSESQSHAGWLDGILGVIYGLELARALGGGSGLRRPRRRCRRLGGRGIPLPAVPRQPLVLR